MIIVFHVLNFGKNVGSIPRIKIGFENKGTLKIEDEEMVIDDLDSAYCSGNIVVI